MNIIWNIVLISAAFGGFLISFYIHQKKQRREKIICPLDADCDAVIYSEYSRFLGVPVENIGLFYYGIMATGYAFFMFLPHLVPPIATFTVIALTTAAFLFSIYLVFIQVFTLKQWCFWCLMSAGLCVIIFASALFISEFKFVSLLALHHDYISILHILGAALGLGGATITDIFFFKFLKDFRISKWESEVMRALSQVIWFALALIIITGAGLYLPEAAELNQSPKFLAKMVVVAVIVLNGSFLNLLIAPRLVKISFHERLRHGTGEPHYFRKTSFALGAVSIISWYSAFLLGILRKIEFGFAALIVIYLTALVIGAAASQLLERSFVKQANSMPKKIYE